MSLYSRWRMWVTSVRTRESRDADLDRELRDWIDELTARYEAAGASAAEARRRALIETGGVACVKEAVRETYVGAATDACLRDVRYAWRGLWKSRTFALVAIATLALGIGATTAIFSVVHALLIAPLPYRDSSELVFVWRDRTAAGYPRTPLSGPELFDLRARSTRLTGYAAIWTTAGVLAGEGNPEQLRIGVITTDFFSVLGVNAAWGRTFAPEDEPQTMPAHVVLSSAVWRRRYGSDPAMVGRQIRLMGQSMTIVGVMPDDFKLLLPPDAAVPDDLDAYVPFNRTLARSPRTMQFLRVVGRLRRGVRIEQAQDEIATIGNRLSHEFIEYGPSGGLFNLAPLQRDDAREIRTPLVTLFLAVGILLIIACLNVAGLLLARAAARLKETAVRVALGAGRLQLLRQSVVEGLVLAALGGTAGVIVAQGGLNALLALRPENLSRLGSVRIDPIALMFTGGIILTWGLLFSLAPHRLHMRACVTTELQRNGRQTHGAIGYRGRAALVVGQLALGVTLIVGAGLMIRTFIALQRVDPGFRADAALSFRLPIVGARYQHAEAVNSFARALQTRLLALPGVRSVGATTHLPFDHTSNWTAAYSSRVGAAKSISPIADYRAISPGYFEAMGATLVDGRPFNEADDHTAERVVIVDERVGRRLWPGQRAVGQRMAIDPDLTGRTDRAVKIVGVVRHLRLHSPMEEVREEVYLPWRQILWSPMAFVLRASSEPVALAPAVRQIVMQLDPMLPVYDVRPLMDYSVNARATQRFTMILAVTFAAAALALACVGVYGLVAYTVAQRRHEFGVRLALGARPGQLIRMVLNDGMKITSAGLVLGAIGGFASARFLQNQLFGISSSDPSNYVLAITALGACAIAACLIPAWRATNSSAIDALRTE